MVTGADQLTADLVGATITGMARRGKYLIFELGDRAMISHLRMEGKWLLFPQDQVPSSKHFQPMNVNFGIIKELDGPRIRDKKERYEKIAERALSDLEAFLTV